MVLGERCMPGGNAVRLLRGQPTWRRPELRRTFPASFSVPTATLHVAKEAIQSGKRSAYLQTVRRDHVRRK